MRKLVTCEGNLQQAESLRRPSGNAARSDVMVVLFVGDYLGRRGFIPRTAGVP